jgi:hypothetical protein
LGLIFVSLIHLFFTISLCVAPRFLFKGPVWLKALPWIISSGTLFALFGLMTKFSRAWDLAYIIVGFGFQMVQFVVCVLPVETPISFLLKPFVMVKVPNLMGKINLNDPNFALDSVYGPPLKVPSEIAGQNPITIRYGSQAIQMPQYHKAPSYTDSVDQMASSEAPPNYEFVVPSENSVQQSTNSGNESSDNSKFFYQNEKTQFNDKK